MVYIYKQFYYLFVNNVGIPFHTDSFSKSHVRLSSIHVSAGRLVSMLSRQITCNNSIAQEMLW